MLLLDDVSKHHRRFAFVFAVKTIKMFSAVLKMFNCQKVLMSSDVCVFTFLPLPLPPSSHSRGQTRGMTEEKCPQLVDYFVVAGLDPAGPWMSLDEDGRASASCTSASSSSLSGRVVESVTDLAVIARGLGEEVPEGFTCIEKTLGGHSAELSAGLINNPHLYLCYRRGRDKPPIVDLG